MPNRTKRTPKKDYLFIETLAKGLSVTGACEAADYSRSSVYEWRAEDEEFAKLWDDAVEAGTDKLEDEAYRRAFTGWTDPILSPRGFKIGEIQKYSDTLTIFLLKGRRPKKFKDRIAQELSGLDGVPLSVNVYIPANNRDDAGSS